jgi:hypothetical protein
MIILDNKQFWKHRCQGCNSLIFRSKAQGRYCCAACQGKKHPNRYCSECGRVLLSKHYTNKTSRCKDCKTGFGYNIAPHKELVTHYWTARKQYLAWAKDKRPVVYEKLMQIKSSTGCLLDSSCNLK